MERKVWLRVFSRTLYPNTYVLLVGGPAIGKTESLREVQYFWGTQKDLHVAPAQVSRASLTDVMNESTRSVFRPQEAKPLYEFNSTAAAVTEFGTFLSAYEQGFMSFLNDLYDCVPTGDKKRGMKEEIKIPNPQLTLVAGTTPAWLGGVLPQHAWNEGFTSRLTLIYSAERNRVDPFANIVRDAALHDALVADLSEIHSLFGQMMFDPEVVDAFRAWYAADCPPKPDHPKLEHYIPRRHIHLLKVAMAFSAARSSELVLRLEDYQRALDVLLEAEAVMPEVFKSMSYGSDTPIFDEAFRFVYTTWAKEQRPVAEPRIMFFLSQRAPAYACAKILETMVSSGMLAVASVGGPGQNAFKPGARG